MHLDVLSDEGVLFRSFKYARVQADPVMEDIDKAVTHLSYYGPPVDKLLIVTKASTSAHPVFMRD
jgi:hypothetical protein